MLESLNNEPGLKEWNSGMMHHTRHFLIG